MDPFALRALACAGWFAALLIPGCGEASRSGATSISQNGAAQNPSRSSRSEISEGEGAHYPAPSDAGRPQEQEREKDGPGLLSRSPEPGDDNVWVRSPIVLRFSGELDPDSVNASSVYLHADTGPIESEVHLTVDRREIRVTLLSLPPGPARVTITASDAIRDLAGRAFVGASWSWTLPLWQEPARFASIPVEHVHHASIAIDRQHRTIAKWLQDDGGGPSLGVARLEQDGFRVLPGANEALERPLTSAHIAVSNEDDPIVVVAAGDALDEIYSIRYRENRWELLGEGPLSEPTRGSRDPLLRVSSDGTLVAAWIEQDDTIAVRSFGDGRWGDPLPGWTSTGAIQSFDLALVDETPIVAVSTATESGHDVRVLQYDSAENGWAALGGPLDRIASQDASRPTLAAGSNGQLAIAWLEHDGVSYNLYAAQYEPGSQQWILLGPAVELELDAQAAIGGLALAPDGTPLLSWSESVAPRRSAYVARWTGRWEVLGGALDQERSAEPRALAVDSDGHPTVLLQPRDGSRSQPWLERYNGSPSAPAGLVERSAAGCSIPGDGDPSFPSTLSQTGCFADVQRRIPIAGFLPYSLNSALWSDGASKRRFVMIPDGQTIGYTEQNGWQLPVGTVLIKEFLLERVPGAPADVLPMETRFLIKRCEPGACRAAWQGYSYQWNDAGTEAELLSNQTETVFKDWSAAARTHRHGYPGRDQCNQCHAVAAGGALGLQTGQLNRNHDYGRYVDNQLRAFDAIGLFGTSAASVAAERTFRLPMPNDAAYSLHDRVRAYFHANCSHCHRPDGRWPVVDLRFAAPLLGADAPNPNICDKLVPGNAAASLLFVKTSVRPPDVPIEMKGDPMPPLATLLTDSRQLAVTAAWIDEMAACP